MELKANERKIINTQPLDYLFTQGESGVDRISIVLPLWYGQVDLSALRWSIQLVSEQDTFISKPLLSEVGPENLTVYWEVDGDCTAVAGKISLTVVGISEDGSEVIKFDGREIMVKAALYGNFVPTPDTLATALAQVQKYAEETILTAKQVDAWADLAEKSAQAAQDAMENGPLIGENGHWFLYDAKAGTHLDSGVSVYGAEGKSPYIGTDGYWYQWNQGEGVYQKTDILAQGPTGVAGGVATVNGELPDETGNVEVASGGGDIINGTLMVWQRYNAADSSTYTNPSAKYVADRFQATGTGTIRPNSRGYGADITGTIIVQYWMEASDFALLPDPYIIYFSIDGEMLSVTKTKANTYISTDGNASVFQRKITDATLDWVSLYPRRPVRPYAQELALCQRYYEKIDYTANERAYVTATRESNNYFAMIYNFRVEKRKTPTVKLYRDVNGTEGVAYRYPGVAAGTVSQSDLRPTPSKTGIVLFCATVNNSTYPCATYYFGYTADAEIY